MLSAYSHLAIIQTSSPKELYSLFDAPILYFLSHHCHLRLKRYCLCNLNFGIPFPLVTVATSSLPPSPLPFPSRRSLNPSIGFAVSFPVATVHKEVFIFYTSAASRLVYTSSSRFDSSSVPSALQLSPRYKDQGLYQNRWIGKDTSCSLLGLAPT